MVLGIRLIKSIVKKIGARRAVKEVVAEHGSDLVEHPLIWIKEHIEQLGEINPRFPWLVYIMGAAAVIIVCVELYVTILEYMHGDDPEVQEAKQAARRRATKRKSNLAQRAKDALQAGVDVISSPMRKKVPKVDLGGFLTELYREGITVKRVKGQDGNSPTPSKIKNLRIRAGDGELYFHSPTYKLKHLVISPETWSIKDLVSCMEGDASLGEIYLEFQHAKKNTRILRIMVPDDVEREYYIKAFSDVIEALVTHPVWVFDTLKHAEYLELQHQADIERSPISGSAAPLGTTTTGTLAGGGPVTPQKMERSPPPPRPTMRVTEHPHGMSPLLRSPIKTPDRVGKPQTGTSTGTGTGTISSPNGTKYKVPTYDLHTNFHTFTNKELKEAIRIEGLEELAKGHRERQELVQILERHYVKILRAFNNVPVVQTHEDFEAQLRAIYEVYNPAKIKKIPGILEHFKGKEEHLLEQLYLKYDIKPHHHHLLGHENESEEMF